MKWKRVVCFFLSHKYYVLERFSPVCRKIGCHRCGMAWGMHDEVQGLVEWDADLEGLRDLFGDLQ